ncbi:hypothetical protein COT75_03890 [Candidatus Beckwithbacteria bacterium CG10_big_fil_rev_8_21_14_0_10_34_10]|uniref:Histidine phosphatase family protein n=1 Tax=Candidatus Beckwithbacteria bacterium CG10_big_fil_rev_8_21_14_0_10_34_10 TaxID=1974495 RepID=A0A2H0WAP6_9BACT|nr:MAG: hypothetical protein COT75_03890 [Candidatus Beckwithbacteria bacterium CG10_big_fil_rev_8_21_14_0_10_34_10]
MKKNNKKNYCTFYLIRHGETEWNIKGIVQGQKDSPLTEQGINQAKKAARLFKKIKFDEIFSSDLLRAKRTAEIIVLEREMAVKTSKLLRERLLGRFQGKAVMTMREELKKQLEKKGKLTHEERFKFRLEDGFETDEEAMGRFITFLRETAMAYPQKKVLIVTHGGMMRIFLTHLGFTTYEELPPGSIENAGYIILECDGVDFFIKEVKGVNKK